MATNEEEEDSNHDKEIALQSLKTADSFLESNIYDRAFAHYLIVLRLLPTKKKDIKESFSLSLREWGEQLERQGRIEELFNCYEQACALFPECETMLNNMGAQLFRLGYVDEAACCLRRSLKLDPDYLGARENLENVCGHLVERWHFRMLNDRVRNDNYCSAIVEAVRSGYDTVLDIGTGTGLLSMFAAEAGAKSVYGCDMSKTMYEMSCDVVFTNQMADQINLIHSKSTDLKIPDDIPEKISLLVTEVFDAGFLGEGVINTLYHAWNNLMQPRALARVIPQGATLYVCAIESDYIRSQNRFLYPGVQHLDFHNIDIVCKTSHNHICAEFEPYTSEWLDQIPGGCKLLTHPVPFMEVDLSDPQSMEKFIVGFSQEFNITVCENGRVDAVVTWFDLHLDSTHTITSAPGSGSCWEQGVYPVLANQFNPGEKDNLLVRKTDSIGLKCFFGSDSIKFKCTKILRKSSNVTERELRIINEAKSDHLNPNPSNVLHKCSIPKKNMIKKLFFDSLGITSNKGNPDVLDTSQQVQQSSSFSLLSNRNTSNVLVEPIQQDTNSFYNTNFTDLEFGSVNFTRLNNIGHMAGSASASSSGSNGGNHDIRIRHTSSDSVEEHTHLENQCIEIIESVMNGESPPPPSLIIHQSEVQPTSLLATSLQQCSDNNVAMQHSNGNISPSPDYTSNATPDKNENLSPVLYDVENRKNHCNNFGLEDDVDVNLASASIKNLSFQGAASACPNTVELSGADKSVDANSLSLAAENESTATSCTTSTVDSVEENNENDVQAFYLSREELFKLNDLHYNRTMCAALEQVKKKFKSSKYRLIMYPGGVPVMGLQALKLGATEVCILDCDVYQPLILALAAANDISNEKLLFAGTEELEMFHNDWDVMVAELVDESGCLQQRILEDIALARATCLSSNAVILPGKVTVQAMMIESQTLRVDSMVTSDNNTLGYLVADFMNDFQMTTHPGICLSKLEHKVLTHPFELLSFDMNEFNLGEVPSYLDQTKKNTVIAVETGNIHAILYWFDFELTAKVKISTLDSKYHWKQAAILQKNPITVSTGSPLRVNSMCRNSCIHAEIQI